MRKSGRGFRSLVTPLRSLLSAHSSLLPTRFYNPAMKHTLYKITFLNHGKIYELYGRHVAASSLWGFTEVGELVFDVNESVVIDPTEERLRDEFGDTRVLHLPMQSIVRVEEVEQKGQSAIRDAATGEAVVTPFPVPGRPR